MNNADEGWTEIKEEWKAKILEEFAYKDEAGNIVILNPDHMLERIWDAYVDHQRML